MKPPPKKNVNDRNSVNQIGDISKLAAKANEVSRKTDVPVAIKLSPRKEPVKVVPPKLSGAEAAP